MPLPGGLWVAVALAVASILLAAWLTQRYRSVALFPLNADAQTGGGQAETPVPVPGGGEYATLAAHVHSSSTRP